MKLIGIIGLLASFPSLMGMFQIRIYNKTYNLINMTEEENKYYKNLCCPVCPEFLATKNNKVITINHCRYHTECYKASSCSFSSFSKNKAVSMVDRIKKVGNFCVVPTALFFGLPRYNTVASTVALLGTLVVGIWKENFLAQRNDFKQSAIPDSSIDIADKEAKDDEFNGATFAELIDTMCKCTSCGKVDAQQDLRTISWHRSNDTYHETCLQKYAKTNKEIATCYRNARIRDTFIWLFPTPLHPLNYLASSYLLYAAAKMFFPKLQSRWGA